jgi:6,7-dimethyl-8-ribityllumazine synthase
MNHDKSGAGNEVVVVVSRFNEAITRKLLEGALETLQQAGFGSESVEVIWVPGAFELPVTVSVALATRRFRFAVALGAVVRGGTPHFDFVCAEASRGLQKVSLDSGKAVGFGLLTCDDMAQALARAGGDAGNKGSDAAASAIETASRLEELRADASN